MKLPTNSIRWRLQIWYASLLLIALAGLSLAVLRLSRIHLIRQLDQQICAQCETYPTRRGYSFTESVEI